MWQQEYSDCLAYIDSYWEKIIYKPTKMRLRYRAFHESYNYFLSKSQRKKNDPHSLPIPYHFFVPNHQKFTRIYYWDSFFMFRGLMDTNKQWLMKEMVNNFLYLFKTYQIIPNFNAPASMSRSQPPFLSSMVLDTYTTPVFAPEYQKPTQRLISRFYKNMNVSWMKRAIEIAKKEYELVWIDPQNFYNHHVDGYVLSRYGDRDIGYAHSSELESGWDMTSRYYNRCDQFLPVDLNSYLYKYETDFRKVAQMFGDREEEKRWEKKAEERREEMNTYMWNKDEGFFYDYGYAFNRQSDFLSLAGFTPLWAGIATLDQAEKVRKKLPKFESEAGLTITAKESLAHSLNLSHVQKRYRPAIEEIIKPKQWDYPNIWSPLEYLAVIGLLRYGFIDDAKRIMTTSVKAHARAFRKHGTFFEKLDATTGGPPGTYKYDNQEGFGWTNAVFYRYIKLLDHIDSGKSLYANSEGEPPYTFAVLH